jgi:antitoxin HigA-1
LTTAHRGDDDADRVCGGNARRDAEGGVHAQYGLSQNRLAKVIGISPNRITDIANNRRRITADTALRLALYFGNSPEFWMNLQAHYDLKMAQQSLGPAEAKPIKARRAA